MPAVERNLAQAGRRAAEEWLETKVRPAIQANLGGTVLRVRTGKLKGSIRVETRRTAGKLTGLIFVAGREQAKVARIWEFTGHRGIRPKAGRPYSSGEYEVRPAHDPRARLRWRVGGPVSGRPVFARYVQPQKPRPFALPAVEAERKNWPEIAARYYKEAVIASLAGRRGKK